MKAEQLKLYLVTDRPLAAGRDLEWIVTQAVKGGVTMVQLREKDLDTREFIELGIRLKKALQAYGVPLIINDRVDVALAVDADGVHIGQSDMPYNIARKLLGPDKIIGLSIESFEELEQANSLDVDYVAASPVYATPTKTDTARPWGLEGLREFVKRSVHPVVGIGGMNEKTAGEVYKTGIDGIAVVSAIICAKDPATASTNILKSAKIMNWTKEAWGKASKIYEKILEQPFIKELAAGTLDVNKFNRYLAQDEIYIGNYGRQMFAFNDLIKDPEQHAMFHEFAKSGIEGEKAMHELLIERFGIETEVKASIVTKTYNEHTQEAIDTGDKAVALAALLPCMWVYNEVGMHILKIAEHDNNPYKEWIEEYGNEAFTEGVNAVLKLADEYAAQADEATRERMTREYIEATLYEYAFWDYGYNGEEKDYSYMNDTTKWE